MLPVFIRSCKGYELVFHLHYILEGHKERDLRDRSVDLSSKALAMGSEILLYSARRQVFRGSEGTAHQTAQSLT